jgi:integrase
MLSLLRAILNRAQQDWEWLDSTPCIRLLPIQANRIRWLTGDEARRLLSELPDHLHAMVRFTLATGLRESNVTGLQWSQIDMQRRCAWIHPDLAKSARAIGVPLNDEAMSVIEQQMGKHATHVFTYEENQ